MDREMIGTGRTYDDAVEDACKKLGVDAEVVDYEVLERPRTALFGLKHIPAKVKVTLKEEYVAKLKAEEAREAARAAREQPRQPRPQQGAPRQNGQQRQPGGQDKPQAPRQEKQEPRRPREERPARAEQPRQPRPQQNQQPAAPAQQQASAQQPAPAQPVRSARPEREPAKELSPEVLAAKGELAAEYIRQVLTAFGYPEAKVTVGQKDGMVALQLEGEGLGAVVGRRGDNLDAMQYLASLAANREDGGYCRVVLDVDDYRSKREASLQAYARKMALQAVNSGRSATLEPMNPYERRIVHSAVQTVNGATSRSIGSEPNRRVIISAEAGAKPQQPAERSDDRRPRPPRDGQSRDWQNRDGNRDSSRGGQNRGGRGGRGGRDDRARRDSQKVVLPPSNEPPKSDDAGVSLYGKIEL